MNKKRVLLTLHVFLCVILFFCAELIGDVLRVGEYQTYQKIQVAIDDAKPGDIVLIYDGIHKGEGNRDIKFI